MSAPTTSTTSARDGQTGRCLRIIEQLCAHALDGVSNRELTAALGISPAAASRDIALLAELGWAEKLPSGRYAATVKPLSVMRLYQLHVDDVTARTDQLTRRIDARARQLSHL